MTSFSSPQGSAIQETVDSGIAFQVGHVYLDVGRRSVQCLNETARQLLAQGIAFTPADLTHKRLCRLTGEPIQESDLPLMAAWREQKPVQAVFRFTQSRAPAWRVIWNASPVKDDHDQIVGVMGTVICAPPEPDWRVLAELAHDLRTPLQSLGMLSAILEAQLPADASLGEAVQRLRSVSDRAMDIGRDVLEWCRYPVYGGRPVKPDWFLLEPFLVKLADEQAPQAEGKGLNLTVDVACLRNWSIYTDRVRLGRLLSNLLNNAIRYTRAGRVEFTASWRPQQSDNVLVLAVVDTGAGIESDEQVSMFEPFERGRVGKQSNSAGSGLGLASVDHLVKELGFTLEVQSQLNQGSAFNLLLPGHLVKPSA